MRKNKLGSMLLSLLVAFGLWMYVVTYISTEGETTFHDIPVVFERETAMEERGLMITSGTDTTVDLRLSGARSNLNKLTNSNISIKVDLSKVYDPGTMKVEYTISYPGDVPNNAFTVESRNPGSITITVEERERKNVPVAIDYVGSVPENYLPDTDNADLDTDIITISGPKSVIDQIAKAKITVDLNGKTESISQDYSYVLCDELGNPVDAALVTTHVAEVRLDLKIQRFKDVRLTYELVEGGGATAEDVNIYINPGSTIKVSGSDAVLDDLEEISLGVIDLATIEKTSQREVPVVMPDGVTNLSGVTEVTLHFVFSGLSTREFTVEQSNIRLINVPAGMDYELVTQRLTVTLRGPTALITSLDPKHIVVTVDCSGKALGPIIANATVTISDSKFSAIGALGTCSVSATLIEAEDA
ncbi:MAG: hypothetical protein IJX69_03865 [Oscillospiraceae bacterium]|nr:hypothetical protein [Oscillospiraceae bacterium]